MNKSAYFNVKDVQALLDNCSTSFAYSVIQQLNNELKSKGYITRAGRVPKKYFAERFFLDPETLLDHEA